MASPRRVPRFVPRRAVVRLVAAALLAAASAAFLADEVIPLRLVVGWNVFALALLALSGAVIWHADAEETRRRAAGEDPGRRTVWMLSMAASSASLFIAAGVMRHAAVMAPGRSSWLWVSLCLSAVAASWLLTHASWALRYAHLFYREDEEGVGGLGFPGGSPPDLMDFAYFSFTIGICFQTSDVTIASPQIRRAVLLHAVQSFAFTTVILAQAISLAFVAGG